MLCHQGKESAYLNAPYTLEWIRNTLLLELQCAVIFDLSLFTVYYQEIFTSAK